MPMQMYPVATDGFLRADENPMSFGGRWLATGGAGPNAGQLVSNLYEATVVNTSGQCVWAGIALTGGVMFVSANQYSEVTLAAVASANVQVGPTVRASTTTNTQYRLSITGVLGSSTSFVLYKVIGGTPTSLSGTITRLFNVGDEVRLAVMGSELFCFQNGILFYESRDTGIATGAPGMICFESAGAITDAQISSFTAGFVVPSDRTLFQTASDDFNRADAPGLGPNWQNVNGTWGINTSTFARPTVLGSDNRAQTIYIANGIYPNDQWAQCRVKNTANPEGPVVRCSNSAYTLYQGLYSGNTAFIQRFIATVVANIASTAGSPLATNDMLRIEARGSMISLYKNDVLILAVNDTNIASGYPGMNCNSITAGGNDDWSAGIMQSDYGSEISIGEDVTWLGGDEY